MTRMFCVVDAGGGFASKSKFLYGKATADLKLVAGDSAGVVTAFYVSECTRLCSVLRFAFLHLHRTCHS